MESEIEKKKTSNVLLDIVGTFFKTAFYTASALGALELTKIAFIDVPILTIDLLDEFVGGNQDPAFSEDINYKYGFVLDFEDWALLSIAPALALTTLHSAVEIANWNPEEKRTKK